MRLWISVLHLRGIFIYFVIDAFAVRPVETRSGGALLQFFRAKQGRQSMRHAGQCALVCVTLAFIGLDVFPAWEIFAFSEDVRMPPGHFDAYAKTDVLKREMSRLLCHKAVEDDLKKQVAKPDGKRRQVVAPNDIAQLIEFPHLLRT